ncbi:hypothetical protein FACS1894184_19450 [Clostridia bacterium]|nr:hypothetical protein FACS1894184_19450 [Clostridia bacterium]
MLITKRTGITLSTTVCILLTIILCTTAIASDITEEPVLPVMDMTTNESHAIEDIFPDPDAVIAAMESIVLTDMENNGNAYMENRDVTPLPLDRWEVDAIGVTVRYPADRLSTFSGRPGAYHFMWYELDGLYDQEFVEGARAKALEAALSQPDAQVAAELLGLPGIPATLGDDLMRLSILYGGGKESDFTVDKQVYRLEEARFRDVTVLTGRDDPAGTGLVTEIRAARCDYNGLRIGLSDRQDVINALGEPDLVEAIDEDAAYYQLLPEGEVLWYEQNETRLGMLIGDGDVLILIILQTL